ncbi:MAG: DUF4854 domain-containing protein [Mogibacterium sp.]|nr:DUF4854 domain-containing protein [Mogibacterium sp.]
MKRKSIIALIITFAMVMSLFITSCGSKEPETIESFVNSNKEAADQIKEAAENSGLDVTITGNDVIYTYDLKNYEGMTADLAKSEQLTSSLEAALTQSEESFVNLCSQLEEQSKIEGVQIIVNYSFEDEVLVTKTFNSSGVVE